MRRETLRESKCCCVHGPTLLGGSERGSGVPERQGAPTGGPRDDVPQVSVVVPSFRGAALLPQLLGAFRAQRTALPWELIVVLDGAPPDSRDAIRDFEDELPIRVLAFPDNRGRPAALNAGFGGAREGPRQMR